MQWRRLVRSFSANSLTKGPFAEVDRECNIDDKWQCRMGLAQNWRRRGMFDEVSFIFPNAPMIPITVVCVFDMDGLYKANWGWWD
jgi:hypothetical protein